MEELQREEFQREELIFIEALISFNQWKTCVEIGVSNGTGSVFIGRAAEKNDGHFYGFDGWDSHGLNNQFKKKCNKEVACKRLQDAGVSQFTLTQVDFVKEHDRFEKELNELCPKGIDFAFIDGCHSYPGMRNEFSVIYPRLTKFGAIVFHDTLYEDGCREFILDLRTKYNDGTFDIVNFPFGYGEKRVGISLLMKRTYPIGDRGIVGRNGSPSTPQEIELRELAWFGSEIEKNKGNMKHIGDEVAVDIDYLWRKGNRKKFDVDLGEEK